MSFERTKRLRILALSQTEQHMIRELQSQTRRNG